MRYLFGVAVLAVFFVSCKDDDLYGINSDTRTYILADKKWQISSIFVKTTRGVIIRDDFTLLPDYRKDDYLFFRADSTFELNDNTLKDPLTTSLVIAKGKWRLEQGEQILRLFPESGVVPGDSLRIADIDASTFTVEKPAPEGVQAYGFRAVP